MALEETIVFKDGSFINNGDQDLQIGCRIWFNNDNDDRNATIRISGRRRLNQSEEIAGKLYSSTETSPFLTMKVVTDSETMDEALTKNLEHNKQIGHLGVKDNDLIKVTAAKLRLRSRCTLTMFRWVKGNDRIEGNEQADVLAKLGSLHGRDRHVHRP